MAKTTLTTLRVDGTRTTRDFVESVPKLEHLQAAVGGSIELIPYFTVFEGAYCVAFCNEDGKHLNLPVNHPGMIHWGAAVKGVIRGDYLVGDIAIVTGDRDLIREQL